MINTKEQLIGAGWDEEVYRKVRGIYWGVDRWKRVVEDVMQVGIAVKARCRS